MTTSAGRDWTCVGHSSESAIKILDRAALSENVVCGIIRTLDTIALTNHRPILLKAKTGLYTRFSATRSRHAPAQRLRRPNKLTADAEYKHMNDKLEHAMDNHPPSSLQLEDPTDQADQLLAYCDTTFTTACNAAFNRPKAAVTTLSRLDIRTSATDNLGHRMQALGKMKNVAQNGTLSILLSVWPPARDELRDVLQGDSFHATTSADLVVRISRQRSKVRKQLNAERRKFLSEAVDTGAVTDLKTILKTGKGQRAISL